MKFKRYFYLILHLTFLSGLFYAFNHFITTPKINSYQRRLWAYENWIIFSFYAIFLYLTLTEREIKLRAKANNLLAYFSEFKRILTVNLLLLILPWGSFLIFAPRDMLSILGFNNFYWRVLGIGSIIGSLIYYLPFLSYKHSLSYYVFIFGTIDNLIAGILISLLFISGKVNLIAWSTVPLLFYFSYFFWEQSRKHPKFKIMKMKK